MCRFSHKPRESSGLIGHYCIDLKKKTSLSFAHAGRSNQLLHQNSINWTVFFCSFLRSWNCLIVPPGSAAHFSLLARKSLDFRAQPTVSAQARELVARRTRVQVRKLWVIEIVKQSRPPTEFDLYLWFLNSTVLCASKQCFARDIYELIYSFGFFIRLLNSARLSFVVVCFFVGLVWFGLSRCFFSLFSFSCTFKIECRQTSLFDWGQRPLQ